MKLAITGGIAEGKSTVASYIDELGIEVVSADEIAREVFESSDVQSELSLLFGMARPVMADAIRQVVFENAELRRGLNRVLHPIVLARIRSNSASVFEVPLLFETVLQGLFDRIWVVTCGPDEQLRRLTARLGDERLARNRLNTQLRTPIKSAFADRIIRTNVEPNTVRLNVSEAIRRDL